MSVAELKERHSAAIDTVNSLRHRLKQKRLSLLDTDSITLFSSFYFRLLMIFVCLFEVQLVELVANNWS